MAGGCVSWLATKALETKIYNLHASGSYTHGCYDNLVFKKVKASLGGEIRYLVSGSAPIDGKVMDFLKVAFSCPVFEGYGLTETGGAIIGTSKTDFVMGHVGGPMISCKVRLKDVPDMEYLTTDKPYPRGEVCMKGPCVFSGYYKR